jgi:hypothetical protein
MSGGLLYYAGPIIAACWVWLIIFSFAADKLLPIRPGPNILMRSVRGGMLVSLPLLVITVLETRQGVGSAMDELLAQAVVVYVFLAVIGVPLTALLRHLRVESVLVLILISAAVVALFIGWRSLHEMPTGSGLVRSLVYWVPYTVFVAGAFGLGASFKLSVPRRV